MNNGVFKQTNMVTKMFKQNWQAWYWFPAYALSVNAASIKKCLRLSFEKWDCQNKIFMA